MLELKTVQTHHVPVRYIEGGAGPDLVFLHGAGGVTAVAPGRGITTIVLLRSVAPRRFTRTWIACRRR